MSAAPPRPPADIDSRTPKVRVLSRVSSLHRFFAARFEPRRFDRSAEGRFNAPDASYGVFYAAVGRAGAFADTFLRTPGRTLLPLALDTAKAYVRFVL